MNKWKQACTCSLDSDKFLPEWSPGACNTKKSFFLVKLPGCLLRLACFFS